MVNNRYTFILLDSAYSEDRNTGHSNDGKFLVCFIITFGEVSLSSDVKVIFKMAVFSTRYFSDSVSKFSESVKDTCTLADFRVPELLDSVSQVSDSEKET